MKEGIYLTKLLGKKGKLKLQVLFYYVKTKDQTSPLATTV